MRPRGNRRLALALLLFSGCVSAGGKSSPAPPTLTTDVDVATAGFYRLSWQPATETDATLFELQEAATTAFDRPRSAYTGPDHATTFTGRPDGIAHYRVRELRAQKQGPWSAVVTVEVRHHPLQRAILFFVLGALVFLATLILMLRGADRRPIT